MRKTRKERELDTLIRDALGDEERELFDQLGDPSLPEMITDVFRGRLRWLMVIGMIVVFAFTVAGVYCAVRFFHTTEVVEMLRWGAGFFFCMTVAMVNKLWHWMEMQRFATTREIKRLELQVAHLSESLRAQRP